MSDIDLEHQDAKSDASPQPLHQAMPLAAGVATYLDQPTAKSMGLSPRFHTEWQRLEPLRPVSVNIPEAVRNAEGAGEIVRRQAFLGARKSQVGGFPTSDAATVKTIPQFQKIKTMIEKPFEEFQASRFFSYPGTVSRWTSSEWRAS